MSKTTILGALAAVLAGASIDFTKLASGDRAEELRLAFAIVVGLLGKFSQDSMIPVAKNVNDLTKPQG